MNDAARSAEHSSSQAPRSGVFVIHASEDKTAIVGPLARALRERGVPVWYDEFTLSVGDSIRRRIDEGLATCDRAIVVLSPHFFAKQWPQRELDGIVARETAEGTHLILPVWHEVDAEGVRRFSPPLADRLAVSTGDGLRVVLRGILCALGRPIADIDAAILAEKLQPILRDLLYLTFKKRALVTYDGGTLAPIRVKLSYALRQEHYSALKDLAAPSSIMVPSRWESLPHEYQPAAALLRLLAHAGEATGRSYEEVESQFAELDRARKSAILSGPESFNLGLTLETRTWHLGDSALVSYATYSVKEPTCDMMIHSVVDNVAGEAMLNVLSPLLRDNITDVITRRLLAAGEGRPVKRFITYLGGSSNADKPGRLTPIVSHDEVTQGGTHVEQEGIIRPYLHASWPTKWTDWQSSSLT